MSIKITKTPEQARKEKQKINSENICPCCSHQEWLGTYYLKGIFTTKKVSCYVCSKCGCEWEVEKVV